MRGFVAWLRERLPARRLRIIACLSVLAAVPGYHACLGHFCMGGHMQHPPYALIEYASDCLWLNGFLLALLAVPFSNLTGRFLFAGALGFLLWERSTRELYAYQAHLLLIALGLQAALGLLGIPGSLVPPRLRGEVLVDLAATLGLASVFLLAHQLVTTREPARWSAVHVGLHQTELRRLLGSPSGEIRNPKAHREEWIVPGPFDSLTLRVSYDASNRVSYGSIVKTLNHTDIGDWRPLKTGRR